MGEYFNNRFPKKDKPGSGFAKHYRKPIDDYVIAYIEELFNRPLAELLAYNVDLRELAEYAITDKSVCECSYELQCCVFDLFPRWYIAQTPFRNEIYPEIKNTRWDIWLKHWEQIGAFFRNKPLKPIASS